MNESTTTTTVQASTKRRYPLVIVLLAILLTALLVGGAMYLYLSSMYTAANAKDTVTTTDDITEDDLGTDTDTTANPTPTPTPTPPSTTEDETADWKTYTGEEFTFKYPDNLTEVTAEEATISTPITGSPINLVTLMNKSTASQGSDAPFTGFGVVRVNLGNSNLNAYLENEIQTEKDNPRGVYSEVITKIDVGDYNAAYFDSELNIRRYFVASPDGETAIAFSTATGAPEFLEIMEDILNTIKFN